MNLSKREKYYKKCIDAKLLSFDIFGTLITRDVVNPYDVFHIAGGESDTEASINELFEIDMSLIHPKAEMISFLKELKKDGKTVILTSDMYLNERMIKSLLEHVGLFEKRDYDKVFVSCDYKCTKREGSLYKIIKEQYNVEFKDIVHIGDALRSDYLIPKKLGVNAIWINDLSKGKFYISRCSELRNLNRFIYNHISGCSYEYGLGYRCFGPLLYGFSLWLTDKTENYKGQLYFLAREGFIILKALDIMNLKKINMKYMLVSRRSINGALFWTYRDIEEIVCSLKIEKAISLEKIASLLNISECLEREENKETLKSKIFSNTDEILNDKETIDFISKYNSLIVENSKQQYDYLNQYYEDIGFDKAEDCMVIDIGWAGTMQRYLNKYLQVRHFDKKIKGLYLGVHSNNYQDDPKEGFLFNGDSIKKQKDIFSFVGLLENIMSEQEGSVKCYSTKEKNNKIERCSYELNERDANKIATIQNGMLDFVRDMHQSPVKRILTFDSYLSSYNMIKFGNHPSKDDLDFFKSLYFYDDSYNLNSDYGLKVVSLCEFKNKLTSSIWKTAYLKCTFGRFFPAKSFYDLVYGFKRSR